MTVYVDDMRANFGRMIMCHMIADTHDELVEMSDKISIHRKWIQKPGTIHEHFDISLGARLQAIRYGAKAISRKELVRRIAKLQRDKEIWEK